MNKLESTHIGLIKKPLSRLGLGCWAIGGADWGTQDDNDSIDALKAAFERGITHFDTAQVYGKGHSEQLIGRALKGIRDKVFIASKMMYTPCSKIEKSIETSLKRLQTDYLDLFYIHWPKRNADLSEMMEALEKARQKGLICGIGVSNFSIDQMKEVMQVGKIDAHQICYNLLWRWAEKDLIPFCISNKISIVSYSSIAQGILTGKFEREFEFESGDHRINTTLFDDDVWPYVYEGVEQLKQIAVEAGRPLIDLVIHWIANRPGISSILIGARNSTQVEQNISAFRGYIDISILDRLSEISDSLQHKIPNTGNIFRWYP